METETLPAAAPAATGAAAAVPAAVASAGVSAATVWISRVVDARAGVDRGDAPRAAAERQLGAGGSSSSEVMSTAPGARSPSASTRNSTCQSAGFSTAAHWRGRSAARSGSGRSRVEVGQLLVKRADRLLLDDAENALEAGELVGVHVDEIPARRQRSSTSAARGSAPCARPRARSDPRAGRRPGGRRRRNGWGHRHGYTIPQAPRPSHKETPRNLQVLAPDAVRTRFGTFTLDADHPAAPATPVSRCTCRPRRSTCSACSSRPGRGRQQARAARSHLARHLRGGRQPQRARRRDPARAGRQRPDPAASSARSTRSATRSAATRRTRRRAPPAPTAHAPRCWLAWNDRRFMLSAGENLIGRNPECAIWIDASGVSRRHARVRLDVDSGSAAIEDLGQHQRHLRERDARGVAAGARATATWSRWPRCRSRSARGCRRRAAPPNVSAAAEPLSGRAARSLFRAE